MTDTPIERPAEPAGETSVWYRGWECGFDDMASRYTPEGWRAYMGGCDLDAPTQTAATWDDLLQMLDDEEDE